MKDMTLKQIVDKDKIILTDFIKEYNIKIDIEDLLRNYTKVFLHYDIKKLNKRIRLMGDKIVYDKSDCVFLDDGTKISNEATKKVKRVLLYSINKPEYLESIENNTLGEKINILQRFVDTFKQVMAVKDIYLYEASITGDFTLQYDL